MSNNLAPVIEELRRAYNELKPHFDAHLGETAIYNLKEGRWEAIQNPTVNMPMPVITVQARGRKRMDGWYKPAAWEDLQADAINALVKMGGNDNKIASNDEICIAAEALDQPRERILTILTAQMVHHWARHNGGGVLQNENGYHSKTYMAKAHQIGLDAEPDGSHGYAKISVSNTEAGRQLTKRFEEIALDPNVFDMHRKGLKPEDLFKGSKLKKWSCGCTNIRSAVYIEAHCQLCDKDFVYNDKDKEDFKVQDMLEKEKSWRDNIAAKGQPRSNGRKAV